MDLVNQPVLIAGGAAGAGAEAARELARRGASVAILDADGHHARALARELDGLAIECDLADAAAVEQAVAAAREQQGPARVLVHCAAPITPRHLLGRDGRPAPLAEFERAVRSGLVGAYDLMRLTAADMAGSRLLGGERGVIIVSTAAAAWDGQAGEQAHAACAAGLAALALPAARDLERCRVRVVAIAAGASSAPLVAGLPSRVRDALAESVLPPRRPGTAVDFARLVARIVQDATINGVTLDLAHA